VYDFKYHGVFLLLTIVIGIISLYDGLSKNEMQIYGEKEDKKKYKEGAFKVYNDYLIQESSEYGKKDSSDKLHP
jgi:hypothetical protein